MLLPIGDTPNPRNFRPWVNWALIALNVSIYLFIAFPLSMRNVDPNDPRVDEYIEQIAPEKVSRAEAYAVFAHLDEYQLFVFEHGYKPVAGEWWDLFLSLFLHAGFLHLAGNMLFLWIYGDNVEYRLGRMGYFLTYFAGGMVATWFFALFNRDSVIPLIGASGAISSVLGLYFILFPKNKVKVLVLWFPFIFNTLLINARIVLIVFILFENLLPLLLKAHSSVAFGAHLGGFLFGLSFGWLGERLAWKWPWQDQIWWRHQLNQIIHGKFSPVEGITQELRQALDSNQYDWILRFVQDINDSTIQQLNVTDCIRLAEWLDRQGNHITSIRLLRHCLNLHPHDPLLADVYLTLGILRMQQGNPNVAYQYLLSVFDFNPSPETAQAARTVLHRIEVGKVYER